MAKTVIAGGAGFIGSQSGKSLVDEEHKVFRPDNRTIDGQTFCRFLGLDIRSPDRNPSSSNWSRPCVNKGCHSIA